MQGTDHGSNPAWNPNSSMKLLKVSLPFISCCLNIRIWLFWFPFDVTCKIEISLAKHVIDLVIIKPFSVVRHILSSTRCPYQMTCIVVIY